MYTRGKRRDYLLTYICDICGREGAREEGDDEDWNWFPLLPSQPEAYRYPYTRHFCPECQEDKTYKDALAQYEKDEHRFT